MKPVHVLLGVAVLLIAAAFFIPSNSLTGHIIKEQNCGTLGCSQLCDQDAAVSVCDQGMVCCVTHWDTGVCDYTKNCEQIREYSLSQSLTQYQDGVREQPTPINTDFRSFYLPLALTIAILAYFVWPRT